MLWDQSLKLVVNGGLVFRVWLCSGFGVPSGLILFGVLDWDGSSWFWVCGCLRFKTWVLVCLWAEDVGLVI